MRRNTSADPARVSVKMRQTRVMAAGLHSIVRLEAGRVYALPKEFAAYLMMKGAASYVPGRVGSRFSKVKDFEVGTSPQRPGAWLRDTAKQRLVSLEE